MFWEIREKLNYFKDLGSKGNILFHGSGEINALFSGNKGAQAPCGPLL